MTEKEQELNVDYVQYDDVGAAKAAMVLGNVKFKCAICERIHEMEKDKEDYNWCLFNSRIIPSNDTEEVKYPEEYMLALTYDAFKKAFFESHPHKADIVEAEARIEEMRHVLTIIGDPKEETNEE